MLYLQKANVYVNGYYKGKNMSNFSTWPNSRVDHNQSVIYISKLNISHSGVYTCYIKFNDGSSEEKHIELIMTANYSKPSVHPKNCTDQKGPCLVLCSSHGGYPKNEIIWNETALEGRPSAMMWRNVTEDKNTLLFNVSSMASFDCSTGQQQNISCSVGGVSTVLSICQHENAPENQKTVKIIAVVVAIMLIIILLVLCKFKNNIKQFFRERCGTNAENNGMI
ncbi:uncharacterized protein [Eucyclogobius newberryi]|uniref:uncharacterized protein n=1 Tax=Eucyclogobius newberryi TaxID=166745 RepID=UPI003B5C0056